MSILSSTNTGKVAFLFPETRAELIEMISNEIKEKGLNCDLNHIKTHKITDMSFLFFGSNFNGNISEWDVSNVDDMNSMFYNSKFNGDISKWNVSSVKNMNSMFYASKFNGDISKWGVSNVENMKYMFANSKFNGNISNWEINPNCSTVGMFLGLQIKDEYKPKYL
jgi:surface protein